MFRPCHAVATSLTVAVALGACSGAGVSAVDSPSGSPVAIESESAGVSATAATADLPEGVPSSYHTDMAAIAESMGLEDPPEVTPERAVTPADVDATMVECLAEFGFQAELTPSGGYNFGYHVSQEDAAVRAEYTCMGRYPMAAQYREPLTEQQLRVYYDWHVDEIFPCMVDLGHPVPEPPSWEVYRSERAGGGNPFFFENALDQTTLVKDLQDIMTNCTYVPPDELLYPQE